MANKTVQIFAGDLTGKTGLVAILKAKTDGAVLNGSGDALTEAGSTGVFTCTVTEAVADSSWYIVDIKNGSGAVVWSGGQLYFTGDTAATFVVDDPAVFAGSGDTQITIMPLTGVVDTRALGTRIGLYVGEQHTLGIACIDGEGNDVSLTGLTLRLIFETRKRVDVAVIEDADITVNDATFTFDIPAAVTASERVLNWALYNVSNGARLMGGLVDVKWTPQVDT